MSAGDKRMSILVECSNLQISTNLPSFFSPFLPLFPFLPPSPSLILSSFLPNPLFPSLPLPLLFPSLPSSSLKHLHEFSSCVCVLEDKRRCCSALSTLFKKVFLIHCGVCQGGCPSHLGDLQSLPL